MEPINLPLLLLCLTLGINSHYKYNKIFIEYKRIYYHMFLVYTSLYRLLNLKMVAVNEGDKFHWYYRLLSRAMDWTGLTYFQQ